MEMNTIILYISIFSFIISLVFLLIQGIYNCAFLYSSSRRNIIERLLFEQFSYEVYSSINTTLSYQYNTSTTSLSDPNNFEEMRFNLNLDSFYDCRGIFSPDLYSQCRDKIIRNTTSCFDSYSSDIITLHANDPKVRYCIYFSNFTQQIISLEETKIYRKKQYIDYETLLSNSLPLYDFEGKLNNCNVALFKSCGILDTMNNILCFPQSESCPTYRLKKNNDGDSLELEYISDFNSKIIISAIVSENQPLNHEWDTLVRSINEKLNEKNIYRRKTISPADFKLFDEEYDNTYEKQVNAKISAGKIIDNNYVIPKDYDRNQKLSIYTRSYIGFKNVKELKKFKKHFKRSNNRDNPLFRLSSSSHHNPIITIVFSGVFLILSILYAIFSFIKFFDQKDYFKFFIAIITLFFIGNLIIIIYHSVKCPLIHIDMDRRMQKVLDAYNKRTILFQLFRYIATLFNLASFVLAIIFYFKVNQQVQDQNQNQNQNQNQGHDPIPQNDPQN